MRIVHVTHFYSPVMGGVEEVVRRAAGHLAGRGYEVYVATYNRLRRGGRDSMPREEEIGGVRMMRPDLVWSHGTYNRPIRQLEPGSMQIATPPPSNSTTLGTSKVRQYIEFP